MADWDSVAASRFGADRPGFEYKYAVVVANNASKPCQVDIFSQGDEKWLNGEFGNLVQPAETKTIAVPDWKWMAFGGPRRVLNHIQDHPMKAVVHRDQGASSEAYEVKPWSTITVEEDSINVAHGDPANAESFEMKERTDARAGKWGEFVAKDTSGSETYLYKYLISVKNESEHAVAADILVPADSHNLEGDRKVGHCGHCVLPGQEETIIVPDFMWMAWGGPMRVLNHIQDHEVELRLHGDSTDGTVRSSFFTTKAKPGAKVTVNAAGEASVA